MANFLISGKSESIPLKLQQWSELELNVAVDYHLHTIFTDGEASVQQMADAALVCGMAEILFSEHVRYTSTHFPTFASEVRSVHLPGLKIYTGVETKILNLDGELDCSPEVAATSTAVIGSVHSLPLGMNGEIQSWSSLEPMMALEREFQLALAIVVKSQAHILGHPLGMTITHFRLVSEPHLLALAEACRIHDKAFELNPRYCTDATTWIDVVRRANCKISLGSDAHQPSEVGSAWKMFVRGD